jgi:hypothetical protein
MEKIFLFLVFFFIEEYLIDKSNRWKEEMKINHDSQLSCNKLKRRSSMKK